MTIQPYQMWSHAIDRRQLTDGMSRCGLGFWAAVCPRRDEARQAAQGPNGPSTHTARPSTHLVSCVDVMVAGVRLGCHVCQQRVCERFCSAGQLRLGLCTPHHKHACSRSAAGPSKMTPPRWQSLAHCQHSARTHPLAGTLSMQAALMRSANQTLPSAARTASAGQPKDPAHLPARCPRRLP
jgi:hypothetical protein